MSEPHVLATGEQGTESGETLRQVSSTGGPDRRPHRSVTAVPRGRGAPGCRPIGREGVPLSTTCVLDQRVRVGNELPNGRSTACPTRPSTTGLSSTCRTTVARTGGAASGSVRAGAGRSARVGRCRDGRRHSGATAARARPGRTGRAPATVTPVGSRLGHRVPSDAAVHDVGGPGLVGGRAARGPAHGPAPGVSPSAVSAPRPVPQGAARAGWSRRACSSRPSP